VRDTSACAAVRSFFFFSGAERRRERKNLGTSRTAVVTWSSRSDSSHRRARYPKWAERILGNGLYMNLLYFF